MPKPRTRSDSRKEEFLDLAEELFADLGYENTSVDRLISGLGVSKGAFYHHFRSKSALLDAALERWLLGAEAHLKEVLAGKAPATEKLRNFMLSLNGVKSENRESSLQVGKFLLQDANAILLGRMRCAARSRLVPLLTTIIEQGALEGEFQLENPQLVARIVWDICEAMDDILGRTLIETGGKRIGPGELLNIYNTYTRAIERVIGAPEKSLYLADDTIFQSWIEATSRNKLVGL